MLGLAVAFVAMLAICIALLLSKGMQMAMKYNKPLTETK